jgi:hypothetical protein
MKPIVSPIVSPKTGAQRQSAYRARQRLAGRHRLDVTVTAATLEKLAALVKAYRGTHRFVIGRLIDLASESLKSGVIR